MITSGSVIPRPAACLRITLIAHSLASEPELAKKTGPPIEPELLSRLFEPFVHPSGQAAGPQGFGLGLWVCYQIVQRLRGRIEVGSEAGWTRFAVTLPVPDAGPAEQLPPPPPQET